MIEFAINTLSPKQNTSEDSLAYDWPRIPEKNHGFGDFFGKNLRHVDEHCK